MKPNQLLVIVGACVVTIALRTIDNPMMNLGSMVALAMLCGSVVGHRAIFLLPLAVRLLTDVALHYKTGYGFFASWPFDYAAYIAICVLGSQICPQQWSKVLRGGAAAIAIYFLLSNFGVWMMGTMYPHDMTGLATCYLKAIPFARGTILGNVIMVPVFFAVWNAVTAADTSADVVTAK